eukprot:TRINITY_DN2365_c0_g1_i1.p3 TRINITY_DN2365_c0_g1~~TRINITY_DN2365_c0_g1_i1.p3  ORF type:complete len:115 (+),score=9.41 TRINITY_DN2365_c0_g1_i1:253-597(+)
MKANLKRKNINVKSAGECCLASSITGVRPQASFARPAPVAISVRTTRIKVTTATVTVFVETVAVSTDGVRTPRFTDLLPLKFANRCNFAVTRFCFVIVTHSISAVPVSLVEAAA